MTRESPVPTADHSRQKALLFCQHCERAVSFPEHWLDGTNGGPEAIECPDCERVIVRRSRSGHRPTVTAVWTPYARAVSKWWVADDCLGT
ncbi:MAG: hypothetical protein ACOCYZ_01820 [Halococcoides sp.]